MTPPPIWLSHIPLSPLPPSTALINMYEDYEDDSDDSDVLYDSEMEEEEEEDYGHCCDQVYNVHWPSEDEKAPKKPKAKIAAPPVASSKWRRFPRMSDKSLSVLPDLPLDVLLEILGLLHPKDLVNVSRTSKDFRATLLSQCTAGLWKNVLISCGAPPCPRDLMPLSWATLLFITNCQGCDAKNIQKIDFLIRRRLCRKCRIAKLVQFPKFQRAFPKLDDEVFDLVPYTTSAQVREGMKPAWVDKEKWTRQYVYMPDVERIANKLTRFRQLGSEASFRKKQKARVLYMQSNLSFYQSWVKSSTSDRRDTQNSIIRQRRRDIDKRLIKAGYTADEIRGADLRYTPEYYQATPLSDRIWKRIEPILTAKIAEAKTRPSYMYRAYGWYR